MSFTAYWAEIVINLSMIGAVEAMILSPARMHEDKETIKNGWEMFECARDTHMNRGVNERKALQRRESKPRSSFFILRSLSFPVTTSRWL